MDHSRQSKVSRGAKKHRVRNRFLDVRVIAPTLGERKKDRRQILHRPVDARWQPKKMPCTVGRN